MLLKKEDSCLLLVDVQKKLAPLIEHSRAIIDRCKWLMSLAGNLSVPCLVTEQYPSGLGHTVEDLQGVGGIEVFEKVYFSCYRDPAFISTLKNLQKKQMVLIGIEAHVCVLQTAMDLNEAGYEVSVVIDAVGSRKELDRKYALKRMQQAGIQLLTSEMVFFEWVEKAGSPEFKRLSQQYLK
ncbi:YcaC related amidohydrolase [Legionella birminghamensis]|uniref:YcaC like amidohydrolase n=1 Tax=Legionella birminghamensis TaxID=28083 RepID=A0A378I9N0_9GAMM|nr:hydrolase [Legionella birminghamensis]KTC75605.1 YcaC related amidohydrolase [Legionella birminghamensis]STX31928.1 YcaC like amidohydrolase [Legionella birminghamensis]